MNPDVETRDIASLDKIQNWYDKVTKKVSATVSHKIEKKRQK